MITRHDIIQRTEEWHEIKHAKIGGTRCGKLPKTLLPEILGELTEPFIEGEDGFVNSAMLRGIELEPLARERLEADKFIQFKDCGWLQCEENYLLGLSPDGITEDEKTMCEIKCPSSTEHMKTIINNDLPFSHSDQILHAFIVNPKLEKHYFVSFRPENTIKPLVIIELNRESLINLGTEARPVLKKISVAVEEKKAHWNKFREDIEAELKRLQNDPNSNT